MRVVYIDAHEPSVRMVKRSAADRGIALEGFSSAIAGRLAALGCCDAVVVDEHLPCIRGTQILAELRSTRPFVARVLVTGAGEVEVGCRAFECGAHDMILKPFELHSFWNRVGAAAETARRLDYLERLDRVLGSRPEFPARRPSMAAFMPCELEGIPSALLDVLDDILDGLSSKESAARRGVTDKTVRGQRATLYARLGIDRQRILSRRPVPPWLSRG
jgi:FixJ family two-component response regulator